jgi:hypothetical protein
MSIWISSALTAYGITIVCALIVAKRSQNWRIRLLAFTVGLLPLCQGVILMANHDILIGQQAARTAESLQLLICALCLTAIHLLNKENRDRKGTDVRLRVAEAASHTASDQIG